MIFNVVKNDEEKIINKKTKKKEINKKDEKGKILNKKTKRPKKDKNNDSLNNSIKKRINQIDPKDIKEFHNLTKDAQSFFSFNNTFCVFYSVDNILYLIYSNKKSIISYNIIDNKKLSEIKNASKENFITNFRHHFDIKNKRDLLLSITAWGSTFKIWNINNWECICHIEKVYSHGYLYSACFLNDDNGIYIITSNYDKDYYNDYSEPIKIYDLEGSNIKILDDSNETTYFIDVYYDNNLNKNFVISGNKSCVKSYDFKENKLYHKYSNNGHFKSNYHYCCIVCNIDNKIQLIETSAHGLIRIWNFHSGKLMKKIQLKKKCKLFCMTLWDEEHIFIGCEDNKIKLVNIKNGVVINNLEGHYKYVLTIKKIKHPVYGECLISQGYGEDQIKLITKN